MEPYEGKPRPVVVVIGALAPYTHVLYNEIAVALDRPLHVLACSAREKSRQWEIGDDRAYRFEVLPGLRWYRSSARNHYVNPSVVSRLVSLDPSVVVLNDFSPTMALAARIARLRRTPYGVRTDGVPEVDPGGSSPVHRLLRRQVIPRAAFGLGPSQGSRALLRHYGLEGPIGIAPLFPAWQPLARPLDAAARPFDLLFCGTINDEIKGASFFTDVVLGCAAKRPNLSVRVVGDGPLLHDMQARFAAAGVHAKFDGFLQQGALAEAYDSARLFLFPTRQDVWGIVVQEALQSGTVVVASPHAGVSRELVASHRCGLVLPLDLTAWVDATLALLDDPARQDALRQAGREADKAFSPKAARDVYLTALRPFLTRAGRVTGRR